MTMQLLNDKQVATLINMSPSWIRVQRWKRKTSQQHCFTLDPVMIGTSPRYRAKEVHAWIASLEHGGC